MSKISFVLILFIAIALAGCSSSKEHQGNQIRKEKTYLSDMISVKRAIQLAKVSYIKGCTEHAKSMRQKIFHKNCVVRASEYVKSNILSILETE
ncbi:MAG: hypothetical protein HOE90_08950 [Bacteriovoracaceae bacterium]|jgi:hypothetical protein|nr:hypothetical protein [Bacteriovoracaceae bacterium]